MMALKEIIIQEDSFANTKSLDLTSIDLSLLVIRSSSIGKDTVWGQFIQSNKRIIYSWYYLNKLIIKIFLCLLHLKQQRMLLRVLNHALYQVFIHIL